MNTHRCVITLSVAVAVLFVSVLYLLYLNFYKVTPLVPAPAPLIVPTGVPTPTIKPSPGSSKVWQTYRNAKFGYEFQYPGNWQLDDSALADANRISLRDNKNQGKDITPLISGDINIDVRQDVDFTGWSYDRLFKYFETGGQSEGQFFETMTVTKIGPAKIGGFDAYIVNNSFDVADCRSVFIIHGGKLYWIYLMARAGELPPNIKAYGTLFNQLLSTFKFTQ